MVSMMEQKNDFLYLENQLFQAVELPYGHKGEVSAMFYLPKPGKMVAFLEELGYDKFKEWAEQTSYHQGTLRLPMFKLDNSYELGQTLHLMGMKSAFTSKANFYGGMMLSDSSLPVQLSKVLHKTFVEVNEKGTEAAAATAVLPIAGGGPDPDAKPCVMEIDRPFVMLIKIRGVAEPLFIGVIRSVNN